MKTLEGDRLSFPVNWDHVITALFEITVIKKMLIIIPVNLALLNLITNSLMNTLINILFRVFGLLYRKANIIINVLMSLRKRTDN